MRDYSSDEGKSLACPPLMSDSRQNGCRRGNEGDCSSDEEHFVVLVSSSDGWQDARKGKWRITLQMKGTLLVLMPTSDSWH